MQQAPPAIILAALLRFGGPALFHGPRTSSWLGAPFWPSGLTLRSSGPAFCGPLTLAVSPFIFRFMQARIYSSASPFSSVFPLGFWPCGGLRLGLVRFFKPFRPLALAQQALVAIILQVLRRFRGAALFRGPRPSSSQGVPFWPSGLTLRSSGPAFCGPLTLAVSTEENQFISPMLFQTAFNFSSVVQRWVCRFSGLRLVALRWFLVFLASSRCAASASSYCFGSAAPPRWRRAFSQLVPVAKFKLLVLASGSNIPVKPTRILRSAYLAR